MRYSQHTFLYVFIYDFIKSFERLFQMASLKFLLLMFTTAKTPTSSFCLITAGIFFLHLGYFS